MTQLYPQILLRTDGGPSAVTPILRCAGYVVTKVRTDDDAERLLVAAHVEAVVVELPLVQAIPLARRSFRLDVPMLFVTSAPESLCKLGGDVATLHASRAADDLVSAVDLLIACREKCQVTPRTVEAARK